MSRKAQAALIADALSAAPDNRRWVHDESRQRSATKDVSSEQRTQFIVLFADWITLRADADADAYLDWMIGRGGALRTDDPAIDARDQGYEAATGNPFTPQTLADDLFTKTFDATLRWKDGIMRPVDLGATEVRFGWCRSEPADIESEMIPDDPDLQWWSGISSNAGRRYFDPPTTYEHLIQRYDKVLAGAVFTTWLGENGAWVSCHFYAIWDPSIKQWWINNINATNLTHSMIGTGLVY